MAGLPPALPWGRPLGGTPPPKRARRADSPPPGGGADAPPRAPKPPSAFGLGEGSRVEARRLPPRPGSRPPPSLHPPPPQVGWDYEPLDAETGEPSGEPPVLRWCAATLEPAPAPPDAGADAAAAGHWQLRYDPEPEEEEEDDDAEGEQGGVGEQTTQPGGDAVAPAAAAAPAGAAAGDGGSGPAAPGAAAAAASGEVRRVAFLSRRSLVDLPLFNPRDGDAVLVWRPCGAEAPADASDTSGADDDGGEEASMEAWTAAAGERVRSLPLLAQQRVALGLAAARDALAAVYARLEARALARAQPGHPPAEVGPDDVRRALEEVRAEMAARGEATI